MKKTLLMLICFGLISATVSAQTCKYSVDKIDPITGQRTLAVKVNINYWFNINFLHIGNEYRIESIVYMPGEQNYIVSTGTPIDIKLNNDRIITVESTSDAAPVSYVSANQIYSVYLMSYLVSADQAKAIATYGIKYSKTHLQGEKYYEHMFKDKEIEKVQHAASCVYNGGAPAPKASAQTPSKTAKEKEDDSLVESMMRKKQEKKAKEAAAEKAKTEPAPVAKPQPAAAPAAVSTPAPASKPAAPANTSAQPPITVTPLSGADELMKWKKLLDEGIITKEEFEMQKKKILEK